MISKLLFTFWLHPAEEQILIINSNRVAQHNLTWKVTDVLLLYCFNTLMSMINNYTISSYQHKTVSQIILIVLAYDLLKDRRINEVINIFFGSFMI